MSKSLAIRHAAISEQSRSVKEILDFYGAIQIEKRKRRTGIVEMRQPRDPIAIAEYLGLTLDPWQTAALTAPEHDILLLVTRQGGKGEVATLLALDQMLNRPGSTTVIVARADRQAKRLLRRVKRRLGQLNYVPKTIVDSTFHLELATESEVLALPGSEETIRGIEAVDLLIIDEAALVPDDLFAAVQPMTATTDGRTVGMTSARGKRGWFYREWVGGDVDWHRQLIPYTMIPRFKDSWIERQRRRMGDFMFRQEFGCEFLDDVTQMYATDLVLAALSDDVPVLALPMIGEP